MTFKFRTISFIVSLLILVIFSFNGQIHAQLDPTFGTNGIATANPGGVNNSLASFVLPGGKVLVVSQTACCPSSYNQYFIRFNADGTLDSTYGTNGILQLTIPFSTTVGRIYAAVRQSDGKIILAGRDNNSRGIVARYNEDGTLDTGFANGGVHRPDITTTGIDGVTAALIQPDGKILIAGFANVGAGTRFFLMRYLTNGSPDTSFGTTGGFIVHTSIQIDTTEGAEFFSLQSSGKIIVGNIDEGDSSVTGRIRRFNTDGSIDSSFTVTSFPTSNTGGLKGLAVQSDDKILAASNVSKNETLERTNIDSVISRYAVDGGTDTSFGTGGQTSFDITSYLGDIPVEIKVMPDGQILVVISVGIVQNRSIFRGPTLAFARLSPSGAVNGKLLTTNTGNPSDKVTTSILPDGKILTASQTPGGNTMLIRVVGVPLQTYILRGIPFDFPVLSNGNAKPSVYRPSDGKWYIYGTIGNPFGLSDDIPVASDYIGNFFPEYAVFRPSNGTWYIAKTYGTAATNFLAIPWGLAGDIPAPADYDGDGKSDVAVFRPSSGVWYIRNGADSSATILQWGVSGDKPAVGDFDGDGKYDIAVFRPSDGNWYILKSSDGQALILHFGLNGDIPVQEDYDGDGKFDIAVYRPSSGIWYRLNSSDGSFQAVQWGLAGDVPVPGDYEGDLKTNIAVWRPSNGTWYILNPDYNSMHSYVWGIPGDVMLPAKY